MVWYSYLKIGIGKVKSPKNRYQYESVNDESVKSSMGD